MAAPKNNKYAQKLKTPELRKLAYEQYCAHLSKGKSKKSWYFEHPDLRITWETMEKYISQGEDLDPIHKDIAFAKGYQYWENIVEDSAIGLNTSANTATLQMVMRNKYDWDKDKKEGSDTTQPLLKALADHWRKA